jgi:chromosome segregation ATPase
LKKYKQQLKQCESKYRECHKKQHELLIHHKDTTEKLEEADKTIQQHERRHERGQLHLLYLQRENESLSRKLESALTRGDKAEKQLKLAQKAIESQKQHHAEELKEAKHHKSAELTKITDAYPKLLEENKKLQEELENNKKKMENFKTKLKKLEPKYREELQAELEETKPTSARELQKALIMANEMNNQHLPLINLKRKRSVSDTVQQSAAARAGASGRAQMVSDHIKKPKKAKSNRIDDLFNLDTVAKTSTPKAKGGLMNADHRSKSTMPGLALANKRKPGNQHRLPFARGNTSASSAASTRGQSSIRNLFRAQK